MGFISDLLLGPKCKYCGRHSLKSEGCEGSLFQGDGIRMLWCESCLGVASYGRIPRCHICGASQTSVGQNNYGVWLPKCPKCGYIYDGYE